MNYPQTRIQLIKLTNSDLLINFNFTHHTLVNLYSMESMPVPDAAELKTQSHNVTQGSLTIGPSITVEETT